MDEHSAMTHTIDNLSSCYSLSPCPSHPREEVGDKNMIMVLTVAHSCLVNFPMSYLRMVSALQRTEGTFYYWMQMLN